ncbi:MAG: uroporphyrinogen decarboxylase family protein, partial [Candidatus Firestonebacteria bacterium]
MNTLENTIETFKGKKTKGFVPVLPIYHTAACEGAGITLEEFSTSAEKHAEVMLRAYITLGFHGVQLTLGVAVEAEAMGARTRQPEKGLPAVTEHLLEDLANFKKMKVPDPYKDGRMPLFIEAVRQVQKAIGSEAVVIATVRGPFITAGQLRGLNA